ncbi:MAG: hypothetical protein AAB706_00845 [Patescibacteria group bacterium]
MQAVKFKNFSDRDFTYKYDGIPYEFKAGQEMFIEDFKAEHFTRHLVDRELNAKNIPTNSLVDRKKFEALCFPTDEVVTPMEALNIEESKKKKTKKVEEEFADLKKKK